MVKDSKGKYEKRGKNDGTRLSESGFDMWRFVVNKLRGSIRGTARIVEEMLPPQEGRCSMQLSCNYLGLSPGASY